MQINVNTDRTIQNHQGLDEHVESVVRGSIDRFGDHITSVEVHLSNENKEKHADGGNSVMMEARVRGYQPIVIHDHSDDLRQSIKNAGGKLARALDSAIGRLQDKNKHATPAVDDPLSDKHLTDS
ncbi:HPF/RaiA family ribosome-associated protein [Massilia sp. G4R7]|uniref:HPF/RaiA family ribosome-associated protein n=1 Tax=Massilia phyllostachyos TaxID=2898585 RepID=A0ABS8QAF7_9BURK|nr:HPF/RaiA family ribosome-associated protein [Massilia phyllostachyos]MCD2517610.1 HPF/RaiA family ribosome-associated protein [Massilia phyllostachyos]